MDFQNLSTQDRIRIAELLMEGQSEWWKHTCSDCAESVNFVIDNAGELICTDGHTVYASSIHEDDPQDRCCFYCRKRSVIVEDGCDACPDFTAYHVPESQQDATTRQGVSISGPHLERFDIPRELFGLIRRHMDDVERLWPADEPEVTPDDTSGSGPGPSET
jgi:hypothetical protein